MVDGPVTLITGGGSGIGAATARRLLAADWDADGGPPDRAMLDADHIAAAIAWAITQPGGVDVNTLTVRPVPSPL
jgi:NADP-dependent 3-hydroxy acid dehydrogenase YdfG